MDKPNNCLYYGVTWGPDANNPGMCIKHNKDPRTYGRLPWLHGTPVSSFAPSSMTRWLAMRDCLDSAHASYGAGVCEGLGPDPVPYGTMVDGQCGLAPNICTRGVTSDVADTVSNHQWQCVGANGGLTVPCSAPLGAKL